MESFHDDIIMLSSYVSESQDEPVGLAMKGFHKQAVLALHVSCPGLPEIVHTETFCLAKRRHFSLFERI